MHLRHVTEVQHQKGTSWQGRMKGRHLRESSTEFAQLVMGCGCPLRTGTCRTGVLCKLTLFGKINQRVTRRKTDQRDGCQPISQCSVLDIRASEHGCSSTKRPENGFDPSPNQNTSWCWNCLRAARNTPRQMMFIFLPEIGFEPWSNTMENHGKSLIYKRQSWKIHHLLEIENHRTSIIYNP